MPEDTTRVPRHAHGTRRVHPRVFVSDAIVSLHEAIANPPCEAFAQMVEHHDFEPSRIENANDLRETASGQGLRLRGSR
jgi:hypothetical protein